MTILVGDVLQLIEETRLDGFLTDPTTATFTITPPTGLPVVYSWPADVEVEHPSLGKFTYDLVFSAPGVWRYVFATTGAVQTSSEGAFEAQALPVDVTIHVNTPAPVNLPGVSVTVFLNDAIVAGGVTDASGDFKAKLVPGNLYRVDFRKDKVSFPTSSSINVTVAATFTFIGTPLVIDTGLVSLPLARVFGMVSDGSGRPRSGLRVIVESVSRSLVSSSDTGVTPLNRAVAENHLELVTNESGYWEFDVVVGTTVRVSIPETRFTRIFRVRDESPLNIADAREDPGTGRVVGVSTSIHDKEG